MEKRIFRKMHGMLQKRFILIVLCLFIFSLDLNRPVPMTDVNNLIVKNQEESEAEIRRQWEVQDRNRRTRTLSQNWPNRAIYEAQLERIKNVNKSQGTKF